MGGTPPLGYDLRDRRLVVNKAEAETVRLIFMLYLELKTLRRVREELDRRSIISKQWVSRQNARHGGFSFGRGALYHLLANPIYVGAIRHKKRHLSGSARGDNQKGDLATRPGNAEPESCSPARTNHQEKHRPAHGQTVR